MRVWISDYPIGRKADDVQLFYFTTNEDFAKEFMWKESELRIEND